MPDTRSTAAQLTARFEALLDRGERSGARSLPFDELRELAQLYRSHTARLARRRERDDDPESIRHLNALCVRSYTFLYAAPGLTRPGVPLLHRLGRTLAGTWRVQALAWLLLAGGLVMGAALAWRDPRAVHALVPTELGYAPDLLDRLRESPAARVEFLAGEAGQPLFKAFFGSTLFVHNTRVGLLAFASGVLGGVPTVLLQLYNGVLLGAFAALFLRDQSAIPFLAWILPHAIPELTAITLCAAGGLLLGGAIALPGRCTRSEALRSAAPAALLLVAGALPLFAVAAVVESFVRESTLGVVARLTVAGLLGSAVLTALLLVRRLARHLAVDTGWLREVITPNHVAAPGNDSAPRPSPRLGADRASAAPDGVERPRPSPAPPAGR